MRKFEATKEVVGMEKPVLDTSTDRMIMVTHLPVVKQDKYDKLCAVMKKVLQKGGWKLASHEHAFYMPQGDDSTTKGIVFAEYVDAKSAKDAIAGISGLKLDSAHILEAFPLGDFEKTRGLPDKFVPPENVPFNANERDMSWLDNEKILRGCEMFATHVSGEKNTTAISVFNPKDRSNPATDIFKRERWSPPGFCWSPQGTYFVAMTYGGAIAFPVSGTALSDEPKIKMRCQDVAHVDFSPQERYVFTRGKTGGMMDLWDVAADNKVPKPIATLEDAPDMFVFDSSERYCIRRANPSTPEGAAGAIEVYNIEKKKKSYVKAPGMTVMSVSPRDPYVATFTPEEGNNHGSSIRIIDVTNGRTLRSHTVYNKAISCTFFWHPEGRYLAAQVDSYIKGKRRVSCVTLFRMDERQIPTQTIDEATQRITTFSWEPGFGTRFAYSATDVPENSLTYGRKGNVSIYDMRCYGSTATRLQLLEKKPSSHLSWSPQQGILLLCDLMTSNGSVEFYDVESKTTLETVQHFNTTSIQWDPSGRFVALVSSSAGRSSGDAGYDIYTFTGRMLCRVVDMALSQFLWRPRPSCALDTKRLEALRKNLPKFRKEFQLEEQEESHKSAQDNAKKLQAVSDEFQAYMKKLLAVHEKEADKLREIYNGYDPLDPERFVVEETVTEVPVESAAA